MDQYHRYEKTYYEKKNWLKNQYADGNVDKNTNQNQNDIMETHFVSAPFRPFRFFRPQITCRKCKQAFESNNASYRYFRSGKHVFPPTSFPVVHASFPETAAEKIIQSFATNKPTENFGFKRFRYVATKIKLFRIGEKHDLCFDSGCIMNLIDRNIIRRCIPNIEFSIMPTKMTVKNVGN